MAIALNYILIINNINTSHDYDMRHLWDIYG